MEEKKVYDIIKHLQRSKDLSLFLNNSEYSSTIESLINQNIIFEVRGEPYEDGTFDVYYEINPYEEDYVNTVLNKY